MYAESPASESSAEASQHRLLPAYLKPYAFKVLGRFEGCESEGRSVQIDAGKIPQTLAYLLVHYDRPHRREILAGTLWCTHSEVQARKNLRQSLWLIQNRIVQEGDQSVPLLIKDKDWVRINADAVWLDLMELANAFRLVHGIPGERMTPQEAGALRAATSLYRGDLLEGWAHQWCVYERERIRVMYLSMLEKLLGYCEACGECEQGLAYGERLLRHDRAHERAHRRIMRLSYAAGDRTGALRQYERCRVALEQELGVGPSQTTKRLYELIRRGVTAEPDRAIR